jgi:hypothetical protein
MRFSSPGISGGDINISATDDGGFIVRAAGKTLLAADEAALSTLILEQVAQVKTVRAARLGRPLVSLTPSDSASATTP